MERLTKTEKLILTRLGWGQNYSFIACALKVQLATIHTHCYQIRKKTGIRDTTHAKDCRDYVRNNRRPPEVYPPLGPSEKQLEVLRLVAAGKDYNEIAQTLGIKRQTAINHASAGCRRFGLTAKGYRRIKELHKTLNPPSPTDRITMADPFL